MHRRDLLFGGLAFSTTAMLPRHACGQQPAAQLPAKIVDVHCHIFNADDLPMVEFINKAVIRGAPGYKKRIEPYTPVIDALLQDIARKLRGTAFSVDQEAAHLDHIKLDPKRARTPSQIRAHELDFLIQLFESWRNESAAMPSGKITHEILNSFIPIIALGFLHRELASGQFFGPRKFTIGAALDNVDGAYTPHRWFESKYLAERVLGGAPGDLSHAIRWATSYTLYRRELALELHELNQKRTVLVTPALVDFAKWLDADEETVTPVEKQVALMERLTRERAPGMPAIHGFVPFDPLRHAIHAKTGGAADSSPLSIVQRAVERQGFIGVKLYPPMGFRPTNNRGIGNDFPCWVRFGRGSPGYQEKCANPKNTPDGLGDTPVSCSMTFCGAFSTGVRKTMFPSCRTPTIQWRPDLVTAPARILRIGKRCSKLSRCCT